MVNAFTFDNGSPKSFGSRQEMYDYMIENGHMVIEGDDAPKFAAHVEKRVKEAGHPVNSKAIAAKSRLEA